MPKQTKKPKPPTELDLLKMEIAGELGLTDAVSEKGGWGNLTAKQTGQIGGMMSSRRRKKK